MELTQPLIEAMLPICDERFFKLMCQSEGEDFQESYMSFSADFAVQTKDHDQDSARVQAFLTATEALFRVHPLYANATRKELVYACESLEKFLMEEIYEQVSWRTPKEAQLDARLSTKMTKLGLTLRPQDLKVPLSVNLAIWEKAQKELCQMSEQKSPHNKLGCIIRCCVIIFTNLCKSEDKAPLLRDFLPVLAYVVIKANPIQLHTNILFIQRFRQGARQAPEVQYFLDHLVQTTKYIDGLQM